MTGKTTVGIVFGGKSAEHEVSLQSAKNIIEAMDKEKYDVVLVGIDQKGCFPFLVNSTTSCFCGSMFLLKSSKLSQTLNLTLFQ